MTMWQLMLALALLAAESVAFSSISYTHTNGVALGMSEEAASNEEAPFQDEETSANALALNDAELSEESFRELYEDVLPDFLLDRCEAHGWTHPTRIQLRVLEEAFERQSLVFQAQTGSGKTLAYLLPLLASIEPERHSLQAIVVVPTRELGLQVARVCKQLTGTSEILTMSILQGSTHRRQRAWAWAEPPQVVVGTPDELLRMVRSGGLPRIHTVRTVVVDEVDACLGTAFASGNTLASASALHELLSKHLSPTFLDERSAEDTSLHADELSAESLVNDRRFRIRKAKKFLQFGRRTMFCSATMPQHRHFLKQCRANQWTLDEPTFVSTSKRGKSELLEDNLRSAALPPTLQHAYMVCASEDDKRKALRRLVKQITNSSEPTAKILIFVDESRPLDEIAGAVAHDLEGIYAFEGNRQLKENTDKNMVAALRFEDSLSQRAFATRVFSEEGAAVRVLFTTDVAASRGLDLPGVTHVVHLDVPPTAETYLHRSGRAGRFGRPGRVITVVTSSQEFVLARIANTLQLDELSCLGRQKKKKERMPQE